MAIRVGSARIDENGGISGGRAGDQTGREVATEAFYMHPKGWYVLRPKTVKHANDIAKAMKEACGNNHIGYDQANRYTVVSLIKKGKTLKNISVKTECDCSSLVRACVLQATGKDVGDFSTGSEAGVLEKSGLFEKRKSVGSSKDVYNGDVLVSKTKGHTVIVVSGKPRKSEVKSGTAKASIGATKTKTNTTKTTTSKTKTTKTKTDTTKTTTSKTKTSTTEYYKKYTGSSFAIDEVFKAIGVPFSYMGTYKKRMPIAKANGITAYTGKLSENIKLLSLAKAGKLKKPK